MRLCRVGCAHRWGCTWAPSQQIIENELDGSIILEMETSGWFDVKKWVLSHGRHAVVLGPKEMADEILEEVETVARKYRPGDKPS